MGESIKVAVRPRPLLGSEAAEAGLIFGHNSVTFDNTMRKFDQVFLPDLPNKDVYTTMVAEKIKSLLNGYNITVFVYGATGSGKTYTMGTDYHSCKTSEKGTDVGVLPLALHDIFQALDSDPDEIFVRVSFLEIYNEDVFDLLKLSKVPNIIREDHKGFKVAYLTEISIKSEHEALQALEKGLESRRTSSTARNQKSSRSHAMFTVHLEKYNKQTRSALCSKFLFVDLAGSERLDGTKAVGSRMKEGIRINQGLFTLKQVIQNINEKKHVPYRDSKLTKLLQDSIGGNCHTIMIACIDTSSASFKETKNTLRYASLTKGIQCRPVINTDTPVVQIEKLKKQVFDLHNQFKVLRPMCEEIEATAQELNTLSELSPALPDTVIKLKDIYNRMLHAIVKPTDSREASEETFLQQTSSVESLSFEDEKETDSSVQVYQDNPKIIQHRIEEESDSPVLLELNSIKEKLDIKEDLNKELQDLFSSYDVEINQEYLNNILSKIESLVNEKISTEKQLEGAEKRYFQKYKDKVEHYEKDIQALRAEFEAKAVVLKKKEATQLELNKLKGDIQCLRTSKVHLLKQIKMDNSKHAQACQENKREHAKILREGRKKDIEYTKKIVKCEKEIAVLKRKAESALASGTKLVHARNEVKNLKIGLKKSKICISAESVKEMIDKELKFSICDNLAHSSRQKVEADADLLKREIDYLDMNSPKNMGFAGIAHLEYLKQQLQLTFKAMEEMPPLIVAKAEPSLSCISDFKTMSQAQVGLQHLFRKLVSAETKASKQIYDLNCQLEKEKGINDSSKEEEKVLTIEITTLKDQISSLMAENRQLQSINDGKEVLRMKSTAAKKAKAVPHVQDTARSSMLDDFLSDSDESFLYDRNDPDWKYTPAEKLNRKLLKRPYDDLQDSIESEGCSPVKKIRLGCDCFNGCKTLRCRCKKRRVVCTENCNCNDAEVTCINKPVKTF